jgi:hypothetical protein
MKKALMIGLAAAAVSGSALPAMAQTWGGDYHAGWGYARYGNFDYPQFRGEIAHIRGEIRDGLEQGWLGDDEARQLSWRLRQVQWREAREFGFHGWALPADDQASIRASLDAVDRQVDESRDGSPDGGVYGRNDPAPWYR